MSFWLVIALTLLVFYFADKLHEIQSTLEDLRHELDEIREATVQIDHNPYDMLPGEYSSTGDLGPWPAAHRQAAQTTQRQADMPQASHSSKAS